MKTIRINKVEFDKLRELQVKKRNDCHAAFSTNLSEIPWPFVTFGLTPEQLREKIRTVSPILYRLVGNFIEIRPPGGRFFVDDKGAYWKDAQKRRHRFLDWKPDEPLRPIERPEEQRVKRQEMMRQIKANCALRARA
jgi:hypothetical protein